MSLSDGSDPSESSNINTHYVEDGYGSSDDEYREEVDGGQAAWHLLANLRPLLVYLSYVWQGYLYFSSFVELLACIYSFNAHVFGFEPLSLLFVLFYFAPCILGIEVLTPVIQENIALVFLCAASSVFSIATSSIVLRTFLIGLGYAMSSIAFACTWVYTSKELREEPQYALVTGLVLLLVIRYNAYSLNPLWGNVPFAITAGLLSVTSSGFIWYQQRMNQSNGAEQGTLEKTLAPPIHIPYMYFVRNDDGYDDDDEEDVEDTTVAPSFYKWISSAVSLGSMQFLIHFLFTGHGTVARWAGVSPFPFALFTMMTLVVGLMIGNSMVVQNGFGWLVMLSGTIMLCFGSSAVAVTGGVAMALMVSPFWLLTIRGLYFKTCGRMFLVAGLVYLALVYLALCSLASEFVPLGVLFYQRQWLVLLLAVFGVLPGLGRRFLISILPLRKQLNFPPRKCIIIAYLIVLVGQVPSTLHRAQGKVPFRDHSHALVVEPSIPVGVVVEPSSPSRVRSMYMDARMQLHEKGSSGSGGVIFWNSSSAAQWSPSVVAVQINAQQGFGVYRRTNFKDIADFLEGLDPPPSIVALENSDTNRIFSGNRDLVEYLAYNTEMYDFVGTPTRVASYGVALLSKYQIDKAETIDLPTDSEVDVLLKLLVTVPDNNRQVLVYATHLGVTEEVRMKQTSFINLEISNSPALPCLLLGDMVSDPNDPALVHLTPGLLQDACYVYNHDHLATLYDRTVDYVFFRQRYFNVTGCFTSRDQEISEHFPIVANFTFIE